MCAITYEQIVARLQQEYILIPKSEIYQRPAVQLFYQEQYYKFVEQMVCEYYSTTIEQIQSHGRTQNLIMPRHYLCYLLREESLFPESLENVGARINRDHATIINGVKAIKHYQASHKLERQKYWNFKEQINEWHKKHGYFRPDNHNDKQQL